MKKLLLQAFAAIIIFSQCVLFTSCEKDTLIDEASLPKTAQEFLSQWFPGVTVQTVWKDVEGLHVEYTVTTVNGTKVEFDQKGNWSSVDCGSQAVPTGIIPTEIATLVSQRWPDAFVTEISKDRHEWDVELSNGLELEFNSKFVLRELDD